MTLTQRVPITGWLPRYRRAALPGDTVAGLTAWAIVVPESVAYAQIAGVPAQNAFYAAPVALVAYAVLGSSQSLVVGATSAAAILSASAVSAVSGDPGQAAALSAALAAITGVILIAAGVLRLGFITNFLAESALSGFLFGMALLIVVRQAAKMTNTPGGDGDFFQRLAHLLGDLSDWSVTSVAVSALSLAALAGLIRYLPRIPASLVVLILGIVVSSALHLSDHGVDVVGHIPASVPSFQAPDVGRQNAVRLLGGGFGLALIVFAESFSISSRFARVHHSAINADQEMTGMGAANLAAGFFGGFAVSGSASRTAAVDSAGGTTPMVSLIAAALVLFTAAFLTPLFTQLPEPVLAAIIVVAVRGFLRTATLRLYWERDRTSFAIAVTALLGVLVLDLLPGLLIAVALSLVLFVADAGRPRLAVLGAAANGGFADLGQHTGLTSVPGMLIVRPDGGLFFGNADHVQHAVLAEVDRQQQAPELLCLVLSASYRLSLPVLDALRELHQDLDRRGIRLCIAALPGTARHEFESDSLATLLGDDGFAKSISEAVGRFQSRRSR